jgi:hypothetical protein
LIANSLAAAFLLFSFVGTGGNFLAFAIMAEKCGIENIVYPHKRIYYLTGLAEGTETFLCFVFFPFPGWCSPQIVYKVISNHNNSDT